MSDETTPTPVTIQYTDGPTDAGVAVITMDDGKANALGHDLLGALLAALDEVDASGADAVVIVGRPGRFSAGFDLSVMKAGGNGPKEMLAAGVDVFLRIYQFPRPVVVACTGHAIAAGAIILMSSDLRVGTAGEFKIGMPELTIGMPLPFFATELMRDRLSKRHVARATLGQMYDPETAIDAGYLDEVVNAEDLLDTAVAHARVAGGVGRGAMKRTRITTRGVIADAVRSGLAEDLSHFVVEG
ncbi:MAG: crotonase/enoyl-CoA hydratase family protein [Acidimicrobiales bacterium]|jgi:enoyl-CoA hydratase|nr:crotonase/enoyl-CoA hydratase family protein [Actinomycetes bacterium]MDG1988652.1 crotonase/enoyl-CoA hydratase family protein [Acidimicrobiales bacterium]MDP6160388.1 crotonase/enoyl-CoA hydratase family protein [Acidimicrobiales bacterium]MDP6287946.1 crotonase/enoyl-CoA hydratase family protein [Acidimicrobiales bacterium]MDP6911280.1 crotonase/enoyl-CoA hydratase family protein [Acidimicrobiales bacterium]|tara:strand:+ start:4060 stop:4788 length:729 start_codon:yes stop_codon:yes gene_type:complete